MKKLLFLLVFVCATAQAAFTDLQFGRYQVADTQWNVSACTTTATCQIYSKNPGVAYKIPWTSGQLSWATGDYIKFEISGIQGYPYTARQYSSNGTIKATLGQGKVINAGADYFFFIGSDNNTGQLFSGTTGMNNTAGVTWTGTLNPTAAQMDTVSSNYSATPLSSGQTAAPAAPALCCGGSAAQFNASTTNVAKVQAFIARTTADSQVYIDQVGDNNNITVQQTGTKNNYVNYSSNGSNNTTAITQSSTTTTATNYTALTVNGNTNSTTITQQSTGGGKGAFVSIANNNNALVLQQKDNGSHYAEVNLSGSNKAVDITQQGSASHMSSVGLSGQPASLSLTQSGATQQHYSINFNCATAGGCAKITVTQGQ